MLDGKFLVQRSVALDKPIIYVGLNYRLGYFGWLASRELKEEAQRNGEVGFANQGLHDQRLALQWVSTCMLRPDWSFPSTVFLFKSIWDCDYRQGCSLTRPLDQIRFRKTSISSAEMGRASHSQANLPAPGVFSRIYAPISRLASMH